MKQRVLIAVAAAIFAAGIVGCLLLLFAPSDHNKVLIRRDGEVLYSLDLSKEKNRTFVIPYGGSSNTIEIRDGRIRVMEAECPDKVCVRTGWLSSSAIPIVCLPNHLEISFASGNDDIDAVAE
ncbi:MAG: NusG domain II-containing protein [Ruminococcus sp.]|nr:NusG domain II-containing protein [uncultured Ruminococcus sp.]MBQ1350529.1 NusG domain II-containing protein [Ruminococcus sp.]MBQ1616857.1 NusG domain II-containing protein [Ruminococcus sp.]MBQ4260586.1 NusG domain II-containing protein [Ruminococcus sp.]